MLFGDRGPPLAIIFTSVNFHLKLDFCRVIVDDTSLVLTILHDIECDFQIILSCFSVDLFSIGSHHVKDQPIIYALDGKASCINKIVQILIIFKLLTMMTVLNFLSEALSRCLGDLERELHRISFNAADQESYQR